MNLRKSFTAIAIAAVLMSTNVPVASAETFDAVAYLQRLSTSSAEYCDSTLSTLESNGVPRAYLQNIPVTFFRQASVPIPETGELGIAAGTCHIERTADGLPNIIIQIATFDGMLPNDILAHEYGHAIELLYFNRYDSNVECVEAFANSFRDAMYYNLQTEKAISDRAWFKKLLKEAPQYGRRKTTVD